MAHMIHPQELLDCPAFAFAHLLAAIYRYDILTGNAKVREMRAREGFSTAQVQSILERAAKERAELTNDWPLSDPLTPEEARERGDAEGMISGVVKVELSDFVDNDLEGVLDLLGEALVEGGEVLAGISYEVVAAQGNTLFVRVTGDASAIFQMLDEQEEADAELAEHNIDFGDDPEPESDVPYGFTPNETIDDGSEDE